MSLIHQVNTMVSGRRPGLYLGGKVDAKDQSKLERWNVTHVLNMTPVKQVSIETGVPNYFQSSSSLIYKRIPVMDGATSASALLEAADDIANFIAGGLCHGSVLVHCHRGISRSTTAVLFYLIRRVGLSLEEGMALIKRRRPQADPIPPFVEILQHYEQQCHASKSTALNAVLDNKSKTKQNKRIVGPSRPPMASPASKRPRTMGPTLPIAGIKQNGFALTLDSQLAKKSDTVQEEEIASHNNLLLQNSPEKK